MTLASSSFILTDGLYIAVIVTGIIGTISTLAVSLLLLHLFTTAFVSGRGDANKDERAFLCTHVGLFFVFLLFSSLIQGVSGIIQFVWVSRGEVKVGLLCTAQAVMIQLGDTGTAFWSAVIAIHTFWTVVLGKCMSTAVLNSIIVTGSWPVILTFIGPLAAQIETKGPFYAVDGAWCFIPAEYKKPRIYLHFMPMLISTIIIIVLYVLVALVLFGVLVVDGNHWRIKGPTRHSSNTIRDFLGQLSWGRLHRPSAPSPTHSMFLSSGGIKSINVRHAPGSIHPGRNSDATACPEVPDEPSTVQTSISMENQVSGRALQLKKLAFKVLWYPVAYFILTIGITVIHLDVNRHYDMESIIPWMCFLWLMGTANAVIYVYTRRLSPTPWSRRSVSLSRSRSIQEGMTMGHSVAPVPIYVDRFTQRAIDDQFINITCDRSIASSFTPADIPVISSRPSVARRDRRENFLQDYRDRNIGFDIGGNTRRKVRRQSSLSGPLMNAYSLPRQSLQQQQGGEQTYTYTPPHQPVQQQEREHPIYQELHPYSRASL